MNTVNIGVFGSAFDPPTLGHLDVITQAAPCFDKILLVPSAAHSFAKKMQPFCHRLAMLELFLSAVTDAGTLEICTLEQQLLNDKPDTPVYTYTLMAALEAHYGDRARLTFIRGPDNALPAVWQRFYRADDIVRRWSLFTARERMRVRSSLIRQALARGECPEGLLPTVRDYICSHNLYCP